jgi:hypothetical protein
MINKKELHMFHYSFYKYLLVISIIIIFNVIFSITNYLKGQNNLCMASLLIAFLFFIISLMHSSIFPIIIKGNDIMILQSYWKKKRYYTYSINDIKSYKVNNFFVKIQLHSGKLISLAISFFEKKDRELLKQLLAETVPVKPS